jgi:hypothetical protein
MLAASLITLFVTPQVAQVELTLQAEIRPDDNGIQASFGRVPDIAADAAGNVYVVDQMADRVLVFDPDGEYVRTFGSSGRELGELSRPMRVDVRAEIITVLNPSAISSSYDLAGELFASQRLPFGAQVATRIGNERYAVLSYAGVGRDNPMPIESLLMVDGNAVDTVLAVPSSNMLYRGPAATGSLTTSLCRLAYFVVGDEDQLWVASGEDGTLTEWRPVDGSLRPVRSAGLAPPGAPLPDSVRAQELARAPRQFDPEAGDLYLPSVLSSICGLERSSDGALWVRLGDMDGQELWREIDAEALEPTRELRAPEGVVISAFSGNLAYGVRVDDARAARIMVYRIE